MVFFTFTFSDHTCEMVSGFNTEQRMCGFALIFLIGYILVCNEATDNRALILTVNGNISLNPCKKY